MSERKAGGVPAEGLSLAVWRALLQPDATPQRARAIVENVARRHGAVAVPPPAEPGATRPTA